MKRFFFYFMLLYLVLISGCSSSKKGIASTDLTDKKSRKYLLLPFETSTSTWIQTTEFVSTLRYYLIGEFKQRDFKIIDFNQFEAVLVELGIDVNDNLTNDKLTRACEILGVDVVISCRILDIGTGRSQALKTSMQVKNVKTQKMMYTARHQRSMSQVPEGYARNLARSLVIDFEDGRWR